MNLVDPDLQLVDPDVAAARSAVEEDDGWPLAIALAVVGPLAIVLAGALLTVAFG